ncbi:hypothetical protein C8K36_1011338 [Rhodococcus sp. OK519]|uniref:hypothetical protein n=1 Tax=Rhodococcus sp. OK519 TaxID=2135729 RepID=UPI000D35CCB8|nr:hypothetical protein C8K36_1011338 [Rhodococcus sp. OK519]
MGEETPDPEHLYRCLSERARLALLRNPQGFVPPEFIGQVMSVCGEESVCYAAPDDALPHFAIFQGPVSDYLYARRRDLDAWWEALDPQARRDLARGHLARESALLDSDYAALRTTGSDLR